MISGDWGHHGGCLAGEKQQKVCSFCIVLDDLNARRRFVLGAHRVKVAFSAPCLPSSRQAELMRRSSTSTIGMQGWDGFCFSATDCFTRVFCLPRPSVTLNLTCISHRKSPWRKASGCIGTEEVGLQTRDDLSRADSLPRPLPLLSVPSISPSCLPPCHPWAP